MYITKLLYSEMKSCFFLSHSQMFSAVTVCIARFHTQRQTTNRSLSTAVSKCDFTKNKQTLVLGIFLCLGLSVITRLNSPLDNILGLDQMFTCMYCYLWHTSYQLALTQLSFTAQATEIMQASYSGPTHQEPGFDCE